MLKSAKKRTDILKKMQPHVRIYLKHFDYGETDFIPCEACTGKAVDIHHIEGRGPGKDVIKNLMALCRKCHDKAHKNLSKSEMQFIHNNYLVGNRKAFLV